jgi:hypothetical protein
MLILSARLPTRRFKDDLLRDTRTLAYIATHDHAAYCRTSHI